MTSCMRGVEMKQNRLRDKFSIFWQNLSVSRKLTLEIVFTALALFISNLMIYAQINSMVGRMDSVYSSNVNINELSEALDNVQDDMYKYLEVRSSDSLSAYYGSEWKYHTLIESLNDIPSDNPIRIFEKNIKNMSNNYLKLTEEAVNQKRSQNVVHYQRAYNKALKYYNFIAGDITELNIQQFKNNSNSYSTLQSALKYLEVISLVILGIVMLTSISIMLLITRNVVNPLSDLANAAKIVGDGNFHVKVSQISSGDEIGIVTRTFNQMVDSLNTYVKQVRESAEKEQEMREYELLMQNHLKEAQLKFLQTQINPHFLFNSLNAGVQLAAIENAEKTSVFLEKMADFFRYNVKKSLEDASIMEEVETVDNYIYILNIRFAGDIKYKHSVDKSLVNYRMPSMILQPIVENAVNHGIRDIEREGEITLAVSEYNDKIKIVISDNGNGMTKEQIDYIMQESIDLSGTNDDKSNNDNSTGVGIKNVISRLKLYYNNEDDLINITSDGLDEGTCVTLLLPKGEESCYVQNTDS